jgi:hypothetical protein
MVHLWRCTSKLRLSELRDALGGSYRVSRERHQETERSNELRDVLGGRD